MTCATTLRHNKHHTVHNERSASYVLYIFINEDIKYPQMFQADTPLLPFVTTEIKVLLVINEKVCKTNRRGGCRHPCKTAKVSVSETAIYVTTSENDVGFEAITTLVEALMQEKLSCSSLNLKRNEVQC